MSWVSLQSGANAPNPALLARLEALGASLKKHLTITSGWRSDQEQASLQGGPGPVAAPGQSHHRYGIAADVVVDGRDIQNVVPASTLKRFGLWPLTSPSDPVHVELAAPNGGPLFASLSEAAKKLLYNSKGQGSIADGLIGGGNLAGQAAGAAGAAASGAADTIANLSPAGLAKALVDAFAGALGADGARILLYAGLVLGGLALAAVGTARATGAGGTDSSRATAGRAATALASKGRTTA